MPFPFAPLLAGYFGDKIFEPLMRKGGSWVNTFGWLVGSGPGAGYGLKILLCGAGGTLVALWGLVNPAIRLANKNMPDIVLPPVVGLVRKTQPIPSTAGTNDNANKTQG